MTQESARTEGQPAQKKKMNGCLLATIIFVIVSILAVGGCFFLGGSALVGSAKKQAEKESEKLKSLPNVSPSDLQSTGELADLFSLGSDYTNIQRENKEKEIKGQVVDWTLSVYEVRKSGEKYRIQTKSSISGYGNEVSTFVEITARSQEESAFIEGLKTDDRFRFKGYIDGLTLTRNLEIKPAILINPNLPSTSKVETQVPEKRVIQAPVSLQSLPDAEPSQLQPSGELANIFNLGSEHTDIQRKNKEKEIKGQVVDWTLSVYEVSKSGEKYRIQTKSSVGGYGNEVAAFVELTARSQEEVAFIEGLKTNDRFRFKGCIAGIGMMRTLEIKPAILLNADAASSSIGMTSAEREIAQSVEQAERQFNQEVEQALAIGNAIRAAKDSASENSIPNDVIPNNRSDVLPSGEEEPGSTDNAVIAQARQELELEKIKLEREKIELEREKIRMQLSSGQKTDESKIAAGPIPAAVASSAAVPAMPGERYPETRLQLLGPADLMDMDLNDLRYAINEMYARRGAIYKQAEIAKNFTSKEWYKPRAGVSFEEIEKEFSAIEADNLKLLGKERERKKATANLHELIDSESNLRDGPGTNYSIVRKSRKGEVGEALLKENGWVKLQFLDGSRAWVHEQNLRAAK